jgi:hypothetical protein
VRPHTAAAAAAFTKAAQLSNPSLICLMLEEVSLAEDASDVYSLLTTAAPDAFSVVCLFPQQTSR